MLLGSIGFALSSFVAIVAPPFAPPVCIGGGLVCGFFPAAGDLPVGGIFLGSVCACNPSAIAKIKSETISGLFIEQTKRIGSWLSNSEREKAEGVALQAAVTRYQLSVVWQTSSH